MKSPLVRQLSIRTLRAKLVERRFAVPKLQREFVWNGPRAAQLLDSIYRRMPIGSVLVWEAPASGFDLLRQARHLLPPFDTSRRTGWFVIDGQQRLSVLNAAFEGGVRVNSTGQQVDFGRLCFDLDLPPAAEGAGEATPRFSYRKPLHRRYVAVQDVLSSDWRRRLRTCTRPMLRRLADCRRRLLSYKLPVVVVHSHALAEVREVFLRINSQGMKVSAADRAFARAATVDLRDQAHALRDGLHPGFRDVDFTVVLQGFAFVTEERELDVGQRALEATIGWWEREIDRDGTDSAFYARWKSYRIAFGKAVDYVHQHFRVADTSFLPSQNMLATLATFFYHNPAAPNGRQRHEIRKWFWATGVALRYSGRGYRQNLLADVTFFRRLARSATARFMLAERIDPADVVRAEYTQRSSLTNAFFCLLAVRGPRYVESGEPVPESAYASRANRSDRHHIFPRQLLANYGFTHREYNSLCNICLVVAEENQRFGMKRPNSYLAPFRWRRHFARTMRGHLIPCDVGSGLWGGAVRHAYLQFRSRRLAMICKAFEEEAGVKLFRKAARETGAR